MKTIQNNPCTNPEIGQWIHEYELGVLREPQRDLFDEHLMSCDFCCTELDTMRNLIPVLRTHSQEFARHLRAHGVSPASASKSQPNKESVSAGLKKAWINLLDQISELLNPKILVPALSGVAALLLVITFSTRDNPDKKYLPYLSFDPLTYNKVEGRGIAEASDQFLSAMEDYQRGNYEGAVQRLEKVTKSNPNQESAWLYLGVSYYLLKKPDHAIKVLENMQQLTNRRLENQTNWYLSQAHLMNGEKEKALSLLQILEKTNSDYALKATELLNRVQTISIK